MRSLMGIIAGEIDDEDKEETAGEVTGRRTDIGFAPASKVEK
jgi:hypothetical protein